MKIKNLLLILAAPIFILTLSWILATNGLFNYERIIPLLGLIIVTNVILAFRNPQKLIPSLPGWMASGTFFVVERISGELTDFVDFMAIVIFSFTLFIICIPNIIPKRKH